MSRSLCCDAVTVHMIQGFLGIEVRQVGYQISLLRAMLCLSPQLRVLDKMQRRIAQDNPSPEVREERSPR